MEVLRATSGVASVSNGGVERQVEVTLTEPAASAESGDDGGTNRVLDALVRDNIHVLSFEVEGSRLQDAFMQLTERGRG